jgi:hypothetical protein
MHCRRWAPVLFAGLVLAPPLTAAKPISFTDGWTAMTEYGGETMSEAQVFYAPRWWASFGAGQLRLEAEDGAFSRDLSYLRVNGLLKRWNLPGAQANVFGYGGLGRATGSDFAGPQTAGHLGLQADYETLRVYVSGNTEWHRAEAFEHRLDTVQAGFAPYRHAYDGIATWLIAQGRQASGGLYEGVEGALLLRLFAARRWGSVWFEAGPNTDGGLQSMLMVNF